MINFEDHFERKKFAKLLQDEVDVFCRKEFYEAPRTHLGASIVGHECQAYCWNTFRWLKQEKFDGRMLRLFNRGHLEEPRIVRWLKGIGFTVWEVSENNKQFRITGSKGHFGGSLDGVAWHTDTNYLLLEFKTHNETSFTKLAGKKVNGERVKPAGVQIAKPQHYKQMCCYGKPNDLRYGLYCAVNKDTDELYFEVVKLDFALADDLYRKADNIINSQTQASKISQSPVYMTCKRCAYKGICHENEVPEKNCRSCINARPIDDGQWYCSNHNEILPTEIIPVGCKSWVRIV